MATRKNQIEDVKKTSIENELQRDANESSKAIKSETTTHYVYIGPSLDGFLMQNTVFKGTMTQIKEQYEAVFDKHSELVHFFIPTAKLGKVKIEGIMKNYYSEIVKRQSEER